MCMFILTICGRIHIPHCTHKPELAFILKAQIKGVGNKITKWKDVVDSKGLKGNLGKTKVMVSGVITKDSSYKSTANPSGVWSLTVKANSDMGHHHTVSHHRVTVSDWLDSRVRVL